MATAPPRRMDWPTAWRAMVPVYGLALVLHAFFPLFAAPLWLIFLYYAYKVLDSARVAESPWSGRGSPRPYFYTFPVLLLANLIAFALIPQDPTGRMALTAAVSGIAALALVAMFVAWSAPPGVRDRKALIRLGLVLGLGTALLGPAIVFGIIDLSAGAQAIAFAFGPTGLAFASGVAFVLAGRGAPRAPAEPARRRPRL